MYIKNYFLPGLVTFLFLSLLFGGDVLAKEYSPAVKPSDWVSEEINGDLKDYLHSQYIYSKQKGLTPYVYIYSDRNQRCRGIRALMKRRDMQNAFSGTHIVMLNFFDLRRRQVITTNASDFTPSIVRISEDGTLVGRVMNPELYLFYPLSTDEPELRSYSLKNKWSVPIPKGAFAK